MPAARKRSPQAKRHAAHKPAAKPHEKAAKPEASESEKPKPTPEPAEDKPQHKPASKSSKLYVNVDALSWRPHPLPRGLEVSAILPKDVIEACLADGRLTREAPKSG